MSTYYAVCAGLCTLSLVTGMSVLIATLLTLRRTAMRVDRLVDQVEDQVEALRDVGRMVRHFSSSVRSGWMKGAEFAVGLVSALKGRDGEEPRHEAPQPQA